MAVRWNVLLAGALALELGGCAGNVLVGAARDGGDELDGPTGSIGDAAAASDAGVAKDGSLATGPKDADTPVVTPPSDGGKPAAGSDAGLPPVMTGNDAAVPSGNRDLSTDKTKFLGAARCPKDVLLCDDFESTAVGGPPGAYWSYPFAYMPTVDATRAARGSKSLHFQLAAGSPGHIEQKGTFPAQNNSFYGRMFVWMTHLPAAPSVAHYTLVGASGGGNDNEVRLDGIYLQPTGLNHFGVGSDGSHVDANGQDDDDWHIDGKEPQSVPRINDWICLEWLFKGDSNETQVWIDGVEQTSLHTTSDAYYNGGKYKDRSFVHPQYTTMRIGWWAYQADVTPSPFDLWIDEVVVDKQRIGCVL